MKRNFGIGVLIFCFGLSSVNAALASQAVNVQPIIVQPDELSEINQQMLEQDRINRDQELAIKGLIDDNQKLTDTALARQQDARLDKINQTMVNYRDSLLSRDRARIMINSQRASKYYDLIKLTENIDDTKDTGRTLQLKHDVIEEKYKILTDLKDEMMALNEKLEAEAAHKNSVKISYQQENKIQVLTQRLGEMDERIAKYDEIIAEKDRQITQLKDSLEKLQSESAAKDQTIQSQKNQIMILEAQSKRVPLSSSNSVTLSPIIVNPLVNQQQTAPQLRQVLPDTSAKDEIIKEQQDQIAKLLERFKDVSLPSANRVALPPIIVNPSSNQQQAAPEDNAKDEVIKKQQHQIDILETRTQELFSKAGSVKPLVDQIARIQSEISSKNEVIKQQESQIIVLKAQSQALSSNVGRLKPLMDQVVKIQGELSSRDEIIKQKEDQIAALKVQSQELSSKEDLIKSQEDQVAEASEQFKDQGAVYADVKSQVMALKKKVQQQALGLKAKDEEISWLNQVLAVAKNKAEYYKLGSQQDQLSMKQVQERVQNIKDDFAQRFKDYDQFENAISSLKAQVGQLGQQLSSKQGQVDLLKSELENKITENKDQENQIVKMKGDILTILQVQANKEVYRRNASVQFDNRVKLAKQLIDLQQQEAVLLEEKNSLAIAQNTLFEQRTQVLENKIKGLLANHKIQAMDSQSQMEELKNELYLKNEQVALLNTQLKYKISQQANQSVLAQQVGDLKIQLQGNEDQIAQMKSEIQAGQKSKEELDSLKQQLAAEQDKTELLKQQLDSKTAESDKMTVMAGEYQKKLESKDSTYNEQLGKILSFKNYQAQIEAQVADLNAQLQAKEAQIIKIKRDMYDLQGQTDSRNREVQANDLNLSMMQQKVMDEKINEYRGKINELQANGLRQAQEITSLKTELALARQELGGMPSSDEIEFLRTGLKKATAQLKQKDAMLSQIKANADEYAKEFKEQSQEFQSLKVQLQNAYDALSRKDEDLKYKNMEVIRLKERSRMGLGDEAGTMQAQLKSANDQIKDLQAQIDQLQSPSRSTPGEEKLKQALDKIDEQGRIINVLVQKLQDCGQSVDLTKIRDK